MVEIRDVVRILIDNQMDNCSDEALAILQGNLETVYSQFTKKWGLLNSRENKRLFADDNSSPLLLALEIIDDKGNLERKSDIFTKRTIKQYAKIENVDTAVEALGVSLGERAGVDLEFMQGLCGIPMDKMIDDLQGVIYKVPDNGMFVTADEYLSGNVREKLEVAREHAAEDDAFAINVAALEKVIPEDIPAAEIDVRLGATWLPTEDYKEFVCELLDVESWRSNSLVVDYNDKLGQWYVGGRNFHKGGFKATNEYGTNRINAFKIIENSLNLKDCKVYDYVDDGDGKRKPVLNTRDTMFAREKQELIKQKFKDWIWEDPVRRERLVRYYNDNFNNIRPREYDGSHLSFVGMNPEISLRKHQVDAVARTIYGGNTLLAHEVGAGKTWEIVASAMEGKRLGLCTKSMVVVPNHLVEQWASDFLRLYPSANVLITRKQDFETSKRKEFCARIATGDYDAVIIGHSQFGKLPISPERQRRQIDDEIEEITNAIRDLKDNQGENWAVKQMEAMRKRLEVRLEKLNDQSRKDNVLNFEELGIGRLYIDESDEFKNCAKRFA